MAAAIKIDADIAEKEHSLITDIKNIGTRIAKRNVCSLDKLESHANRIRSLEDIKNSYRRGSLFDLTCLESFADKAQNFSDLVDKLLDRYNKLRNIDGSSTLIQVKNSISKIDNFYSKLEAFNTAMENIERDNWYVNFQDEISTIDNTLSNINSSLHTMSQKSNLVIDPLQDSKLLPKTNTCEIPEDLIDSKFYALDIYMSPDSDISDQNIISNAHNYQCLRPSDQCTCELHSHSSNNSPNSTYNNSTSDNSTYNNSTSSKSSKSSKSSCKSRRSSKSSKSPKSSRKKRSKRRKNKETMQDNAGTDNNNTGLWILIALLILLGFIIMYLLTS